MYIYICVYRQCTTLNSKFGRDTLRTIQSNLSDTVRVYCSDAYKTSVSHGEWIQHSDGGLFFRVPVFESRFRIQDFKSRFSNTGFESRFWIQVLESRFSNPDFECRVFEYRFSNLGFQIQVFESRFSNPDFRIQVFESRFSNLGFRI